MRLTRSLLTLCLFLPAAMLPGQDWEGAIQPLLQENCLKCHGGAKQKGGLDLRSLESVIRGGDSGPAIVPQHPERSRLIELLDADADPHMPPKGQLSDEQIELLETWIAHLDVGATQAGTAAVADSAAAPNLPPGVDPSLAVDLFLQARWSHEGIVPSPVTGDRAFVRRVYLDLVGRIPTPEERDQFLADTDSRKRFVLIDRLTESPEHASHLAEIFNVVFLDREDEKKKKRGERKAWLEYLRWVFESNRPWDQVARDLLVARPGTKQESGASWFLYEQRDDHQQMATRASASLLGKQVQCAQCHDHPVSPEIEQRHYWGLVSFFSRSVNVKTPDGPRVAERASGGYAKFSNLEGESSETELVLLDGAKVEEPSGRRDEDKPDFYLTAPPDQWFKKLKKDEKLKKDLGSLPVPKFSRREAFAAAAISGNPDFARAMVNRIWAIVFGRGLVHPVDQMDSAHPPSHPKLLSWLAEDFATSGYDVRRLVRLLLKTQAYQLESRWSGEGAVPPQDHLFARGLHKPLSAEVLYRSMRVAAGYGTAPDEETRAAFVRAFPDLFAEVYSPSVQQAMFISNGRLVDQLLADGSPLVTELAGLDSTEDVALHAFDQILGRHPDQEELVHGIEALGEGGKDSIRHLCWALLAGAEFRINH